MAVGPDEDDHETLDGADADEHNRPAAADAEGHDRTDFEPLAEVLHEVACNGHPNKLYILFKAVDGINKSRIEEHTHLRPDHVEKLKTSGFLRETQTEYQLTLFGEVLIDSIETIYHTLWKMNVNGSTDPDLLEFLRLTGWDTDLTDHWERFADATIISQQPMAKYTKLVQTATAIREVSTTINVPEEYRHRIQVAEDLDPARVEFIHTPQAYETVLEADHLVDMAQEHDRRGVSTHVLQPDAPVPGYNLGLLQIDETLVSEMRGATEWLDSFDLSDWLVVLEAQEPHSDRSHLLISDSEAVREWACGDTGVYTRYKELAEPDSWLGEPDTQAETTGLLAERLLER